MSPGGGRETGLEPRAVGHPCWLVPQLVQVCCEPAETAARPPGSRAHRWVLSLVSGSILTCRATSGPVKGPRHTTPRQQAMRLSHFITTVIPAHKHWGRSHFIGRKLRLREAGEISPGHTAAEWQSWNASPCLCSRVTILNPDTQRYSLKNVLFNIKTNPYIQNSNSLLYIVSSLATLLLNETS